MGPGRVFMTQNMQGQTSRDTVPLSVETVFPDVTGLKNRDSFRAVIWKTIISFLVQVIIRITWRKLTVSVRSSGASPRYQLSAGAGSPSTRHSRISGLPLPGPAWTSSTGEVTSGGSAIHRKKNKV